MNEPKIENAEKLKSAIGFQLYQSDSYLLGPYGGLKKESSEKCEVPARLAPGHKIQFNFEKLRAMGVVDAATQFKGLVVHLALLHAERMHRLSGGMEHLKPYAHMAAELATWHKLDRSVWKVSDKFPKPRDFGFADGLSMEEYFKLLLEKNPPSPQQMVGGKGEGEGETSPTFSEQAKAMGAKGQKEYYDQDASQWANINSVEQEAMREQVLAKIEQALKSRGTDADKLQRLWEEIKGAKKEKWYERFLRLIGTRMSASSLWKSSWLRVSRKLGWMFPGRKHETRGGLTIVWDDSGSVSDTDGSIFVAKTRQMAKAFGAPYLLIICDCTIQFSKMIKSDKDLKSVKITGGGGTSSLPVFELLQKPEYKTDLLVYLTDLEIDFPKDPPPYEVIWGVIGQEDKTMKAPFGKTYHLTVEE